MTLVFGFDFFSWNHKTEHIFFFLTHKTLGFGNRDTFLKIHFLFETKKFEKSLEQIREYKEFFKNTYTYEIKKSMKNRANSPVCVRL